MTAVKGMAIVPISARCLDHHPNRTNALFEHIYTIEEKADLRKFANIRNAEITSDHKDELVRCYAELAKLVGATNAAAHGIITGLKARKTRMAFHVLDRSLRQQDWQPPTYFLGVAREIMAWREHLEHNDTQTAYLHKEIFEQAMKRARNGNALAKAPQNGSLARPLGNPSRREPTVRNPDTAQAQGAQRGPKRREESPSLSPPPPKKRHQPARSRSKTSDARTSPSSGNPSSSSVGNEGPPPKLTQTAEQAFPNTTLSFPPSTKSTQSATHTSPDKSADAPQVLQRNQLLQKEESAKPEHSSCGEDSEVPVSPPPSSPKSRKRKFSKIGPQPQARHRSPSAEPGSPPTSESSPVSSPVPSSDPPVCTYNEIVNDDYLVRWSEIIKTHQNAKS